MDSPSRRAMIFRMVVSGTSVKSVDRSIGRSVGRAGPAGGAGKGADANGAAAGSAAAFSMSRLMIRPLGPEPWTLPRSRPLACARRRARGDERTTSPVVCEASGSIVGAGVGVGAGAEIRAGTGVGAGAVVWSGGAVGAPPPPPHHHHRRLHQRRPAHRCSRLRRRSHPPGPLPERCLPL